MRKSRLLLLGLITLLMAPIGWLTAGLPDVWRFLEWDKADTGFILIGLSLGGSFAFFVNLYSDIDENAPHIQDQHSLVKGLKLTFFDCIFLAFCAGFGEEMLFRQGIQPWLGPWITSVLFVAVHGYLHPKKWNVTKYGLMVLLFIVLLSLGKTQFGIWFCIAGHFAYDFVLFYLWKSDASSADQAA